MHRASCVAFFCAAFFRIRITTRVPQNSMNSCGFLVSTEKSRSQRFELTSSHTHHHTSRRAHGGHWLRRSRARGAAVHRRRMVHPSIAGAWCILPSRARGASVDRGPGLHCGRGWQLSRAVLFSPCKSCTKGLRSVPALALLQHARVAACPGAAVLGTAAIRDRNGAARARDRQLPAIDSFRDGRHFFAR